MSLSTDDIIRQTKNWVDEIVIGLNLCPFAARPFNDDSIEYIVVREDDSTAQLEQHLQQLALCFSRLDNDAGIETSLLIFADTYEQFEDYLELLHLANLLLDDLHYSGTYQLASFHPHYLFEGCAEDDVSNYSNRSPYPMLHVIRELSLEKAIASYPGIEDVPENNIKKLREIGLKEMQAKIEKLTR